MNARQSIVTKLVVASILSALSFMVLLLITHPLAGLFSQSAYSAQNGHYYLYPYNLHLTVGVSNPVRLTVIDDAGQAVTGAITYYGYDTSLIAVAADGAVTPLRTEGSSEIGTTVHATFNGAAASSGTIVRVLSQTHTNPFVPVSGTNTTIYYPTTVNGADLTADVNRHQMITVTEYAYAIQNQLMGLQPFSGARQILEVDFGETEQQRVCGISGNPIRLGWNIAGTDWQNCFLVPFIAPLSA